jgi:hypothetical protein
MYQARGLASRFANNLRPFPSISSIGVFPSVVHRITRMREMKLQDLKSKSPTELLVFAEEHSVENASTMRKQELMFAILKQLAQNEVDIIGEGVVEVLQDGFGFLRAPEANYLPGPDDIYVSPSQIRRFGLRTGDTIEGEIGVRRRANAISPSSRSTPSTSKTPNNPATRSTSTTSRRSIPTSGCAWSTRIPPRRISLPASSTSSRRSARASAP